MIRKIGLFAAMVLSSGGASGETITHGEFYEDRSGYPCFVTLHTNEDKRITLQLSDYRGIWSINFIVSDRASIYRQFFSSTGLRDRDAFEDAFDEVLIAEHPIALNETSLFEVRLEDVDERTTGTFRVVERHNVSSALDAMAGDGIEIHGLVSLDGTAAGLNEFRACSYAAMGLQEGERVETDYRAEYRMIFEDAFENWVASMARAEHCLAARFDDEAVSEVVDSAADAFFPGVLNFRARREYREDLEGILPFARLSGMVDARREGCLMVERLAEISRIPVDRTIEEAAEID